MQRGFAFVAVFFVAFIVVIGVFAAFVFVKKGEAPLVQNNEIIWEYDRESREWRVKGSPPDCVEPLAFSSPVDVTKASGVLYPGQIRGTDYKPHGGFRFDNLESNSVDVHAPMDAYLVDAARHYEGGEIQYALYFINDCGLMYKLDHLLKLADKFEDYLDDSNVPVGKEGDSRTTQIRPKIFVENGDLVATKVGFERTKNIFMDLGVYDLRKQNGVNYSADFISNHDSVNQYGKYALCWLDNLEEPAKSIAKSLPGSDITSGSESDYCE